jgi:hypothetical protein
MCGSRPKVWRGPAVAVRRLIIFYSNFEQKISMINSIQNRTYFLRKKHSIFKEDVLVEDFRADSSRRPSRQSARKLRLFRFWAVLPVRVVERRNPDWRGGERANLDVGFFRQRGGGLSFA